MKIELWTTRPGRWRGRGAARHAAQMQAEDVSWQVGVLRNGEENVVWAVSGREPGWAAARAATIVAVRELAAVEGLHEYRLRIDDAEGIVTPGLDSDGVLVLGDLERLIPADRETG